MLEWFTETSGRQRLAFGLIGLALNVALLFFGGFIWFWGWAIAVVLLLSSTFGEWQLTGMTPHDYSRSPSPDPKRQTTDRIYSGKIDTPPPIPDPDEPKLAWHENLWIDSPMLLLFVGGAIGGACGGAAWTLNQQVFQKTRHPVLRYVWPGLISVTALVIYGAAAAFLVYQFKSHQ